MTATAQHEFHPDAERLNAFAEQALTEPERAEVFAHLAVCGRCRQVVTLAREAAEAEVEARPVRQAVVQPNTSWRSWRFVWVPAAVTAAFAVTAVSIYIRQAEKRAEVAKIEAQNEERNPAMIAAPAQPHFVEETPAPAAPEAKAGSAAGGGGAPSERTRAGTAPGRAGAKYVEPYEGVVGRTYSDHREQGDTRQVVVVPAAPAASGAMPAISEFEEQRKSVEQRAAQKQLAATKAPAASGMPDYGSGAQSNTEQVAVTAATAQVESQPIPVTSNATSRKALPSLFSTARAANSTPLPSGLPTVAAAAAGHVLVAIDKAGAVFVSEDFGTMWEPVTKQWTGRAVTVRKQNAAGGNPGATPEVKAGSKGTADSETKPSSAKFEIINDQGNVWASADGKTWAPE